MRRSRLIAVVLVGLLGLWLLWRQFVERQRAMQQYDTTPAASLPAWMQAPTNSSAVKSLASTAERTHNQSDALTQPQEPAPPPLPQIDLEQPATVPEDAPAEDLAPASELAATVPEDAPAEDLASASELAAAPADDLMRIEGIGPKISTIVAAAGITAFAELADQEVERLAAILDEAGIHTANPSTWPQQADLAAQGKWEELQELQDRIKNGRLET